MNTEIGANVPICVTAVSKPEQRPAQTLDPNLEGWTARDRTLKQGPVIPTRAKVISESSEELTLPF